MLRMDIKFDEIDTDFLDFKIPKKLPEPIKGIVEGALDEQKKCYQDSPRDNSEHLRSVYYFSKFYKVFGDDYVNIWIDLVGKDEESAIKLATYVSDVAGEFSILMSMKIYANLYYSYNCLLKNKVEEAISCIEDYEKTTNPLGINEEIWAYFNDQMEHDCIPQSVHHSTLSKLKAYLSSIDEVQEKNKLNNNKGLSESGLPFSNKINVKNAEAIFVVKKLNEYFCRDFGKPYHGYVATFVNEIFNTEYDDLAVIGLLRSR